MPEIQNIEYFRLPPRWLFVKITDGQGNYGWGEATLEGHTQAVEGCLDALIQRFAGFEAEYMNLFHCLNLLLTDPCLAPATSSIFGSLPIVSAFTAVDLY